MELSFFFTKMFFLLISDSPDQTLVFIVICDNIFMIDIIARSALSVRGTGKSDVRPSVRSFVRSENNWFLPKGSGGVDAAAVYW